MNVVDKDVIKYKIKCCKKYRNKLIRHLASDFSSAFIIITPTKKGDLIVDFSLKTDTYFHIVDNLKIVK